MSFKYHHHLSRCWSHTRTWTLLLAALCLSACGGGSQDPSSGSASSGSSGHEASARSAATNYEFDIWVGSGGNVTSSPSGINCTAAATTTHCTAFFKIGSTVALTATPGSGGSVSAWGGSCAGKASTCSIVMADPRDVSVTFAGTTTTPPPATTGAPMVLFTDIASGPTTGGEDNDGVYLSIFGKNFGSTLSDVSVTIGGHSVARVMSLGSARVGAANAQIPLQQIVVQVGSLGGAALGTSLPIVVGVKQSNGTVDDSATTSAAMFMPTPGRILFVSLTGNAAGGTPGNIALPYRYVQRSSYTDTSGAFAASLPGDVIVMRAGTWQDLGFENYFVRFIRGDATACGGGRGSGLAPSATGGPITLMGYPGEDVFIDIPPTINGVAAEGALAGLNGQNYPCAGQYINISNLRVEGGGGDGAINLEVASTGWRIVNNEITAKTATSSALAGGIAGDGPNISIYGNYIHDVYCGTPTAAPPWPGPMQNHGIYIDGGGVNPNYQGGTVQGTYDIAYNFIKNVFGGYGLNVYNDSNSAATIANVHFHHNLIDGTGKGGVNIADGSGSGIEVYNNVVVNTGYAALRFNTETLSGARIYNNAFYNVNLNKDAAVGMIENDWNVPAGGWDVENNIFYSVPSPYGVYFTGDVGMTKSMGTFTNNLYFNGQGSTSLDAKPVLLNPEFVANGTISSTTGMVSGYNLNLLATSPAIHAGSNAVASLVTLDFAQVSVGSPATFDIGPYSFTP